MRLHLRAIFAFDHDVGRRETLRHVAAAGFAGPRTLPFERQAGGGGNPTDGLPAPKRSSWTERRVGCARLVHIDDEWQRSIIDADEGQRLFRRRHRSRGDRGDRLADIAHDAARRVVRLARRARIARTPGWRAAAADVDRPHPRMRMRRTQDAAAQACPAGATSTVKRVAPVTLARPFCRGAGLPITASSAFGGSGGGSSIGILRVRPCRDRRSRSRTEMSRRVVAASSPWSAFHAPAARERRGDDMRIGAAAADMAADRALDIFGASDGVRARAAPRSSSPCRACKSRIASRHAR